MRPYAANLNTGAGPYSGLNLIKVVSVVSLFSRCKGSGFFWDLYPPRGNFLSTLVFLHSIFGRLAFIFAKSNGYRPKYPVPPTVYQQKCVSLHLEVRSDASCALDYLKKKCIFFENPVIFWIPLRLKGCNLIQITAIIAQTKWKTRQDLYKS
mgnify:CR=1 FL=1